MTETGKNIRTLREKKRISVKYLQEIYGFTTPQAIYKWQQGNNLPSIDHLIQLAGILDVTIDEILAIDKL